MAVTARFSLLDYKNRFTALVGDTDQRTLARWALACTERVLHYFEDSQPEDRRPREALEALERWIESGDFKMKAIRGAALAAHAAARETGEDNPARSAARAAGQALATAHVRDHALAAASYALQAVHRASEPAQVEAAVKAEFDWQHQHLLDLMHGSEE